MPEPVSVRDALSAAVDSAAAAPDAPTPAPAPAPAPDAAPAPAAAPAGAVPDAPAAAAPAHGERNPFAPAEGLVAKQAAPTPAPEAAPAPEALRAPASWKAGLREHWTKLAPDVQNEIVRREREIAENMRGAAEVRKFQDRFMEVASPYRHIIEAEGADPIKAFHDYLKTATLLRTGSPAIKAQALAGIIQQFGVPLEQLDAALVAAIQGRPQQLQQPPQQSLQQPPQQPQFRDPRLDQLLAQAAAARAESVRAEVEAFGSDGKHEFFNDVRGTMADLMDAAEKRGVRMGLQDAYDRACLIEPEVKQTLDARAAKGGASQAARTLALARHAASSLPPAGAPPASKTAADGSAPASVRSALLQSIDSLQNAA